MELQQIVETLKAMSLQLSENMERQAETDDRMNNNPIRSIKRASRKTKGGGGAPQHPISYLSPTHFLCSTYPYFPTSLQATHLRNGPP